MTNRAEKLLREAKRFIESGEEAQWAAAERMWQANKEEGASAADIADRIGVSKQTVLRHLRVFKRYGAEQARPRFTDALYEQWGTTPEDREDRGAVRVAKQRPDKIVEAITKAGPEQRREIMRGIASEPVLHHEAGAALSSAAQTWKDEGDRVYRDRAPDAANAGDWMSAHVDMQTAEARLKAALDKLRKSDLDDHEWRVLDRPLSRIKLLIDWIESYRESGNRSFDAELDALLRESA